MSKMATLAHTSILINNLTNYIRIVQELITSLLIQHILKFRIIINILEFIYQSHNPVFFSKAASNERRLPEHSLYLK